MKYSAINIQGNILTSEILEKIRREDIRHQKPMDFNLDPNTTIRDEISLAWSMASSNWKAFQQKRENLREADTGTTETRRFWMMPLLNLLGYDISVATAEIINEKSYAISHRASNLEGFPVHIVGVNQSLDKRAESGGARLSPHALAQEYLNNHEHLYALVTNGKYLRLLRDATLLSRLSFVEFNLEQIMEENLYAEFALLYRLLHSTRLPQKMEEGPESVLEFYHIEALASGSRIRERLSKAVEVSIKDLANGLLSHPDNKELRLAIENGKIQPKDFYLYNLRIIYRMLFLLVIEDRKLIYPEKVDEEVAKKKDFYYNYYSLQRLTNLAENLLYVDPKKTDLWKSLLTTFSLFEYKEYGDKLEISPLGSGLFHPNSLGIVRNQNLDNEILLRVLRYLVSFENENQQRVRVNYADLDVEEFGSVYEGLLEYEPTFETNLGLPVFTFVKGDERSSSGSHYTPEELVKPLIDHSLQYQIEEKLKEEDPEKGLLSLTVCDVACGSGHILLSAARRIGFELAKVRSKEDQPTPSLLRVAIRDVINHCIYGVDLNPLAVELCKVALWLEAHQPGEPLNFLDHHIKCGNAIVGLAHFEELKNGIATEAFKTLPGDDKEVAATFRKANDDQRKKKGQLSLHDLEKVEANIKDIQHDFTVFLSMPEHTPQQIEAKTKAYESLTSEKKWFRIKQLADLQVAQFFIPKIAENREKLTTEATYQNYLNSGAQIQNRGAAMAMAAEKRFFHWFLEFPQIFVRGGFDCILGNPPFLGGQKLSGSFGNNFLECIKHLYSPIGAVDLSTYFFRRIFMIIRKEGFLSLISTKSIAQGGSREGGLEVILNTNGQVNFAVRSMRWPGTANVDVSLINIYKGIWKKDRILDNKAVKIISSYLDSAETIGNPYKLIELQNKSFQGSIPLGKGFLIKPKEAEKFINSNTINTEVLKQYLNGDDINNDPGQSPSRWVINFQDFSQKYCEERYPLLYDIVYRTVKPERDKVNREVRRKIWWQFAEKASKLYETIKDKNRVLVQAQTSKYLTPIFKETGLVFSMMAIVFDIQEYKKFSILSSIFHNEWAWKYCSTNSISLRYTPSSAFETFPFPKYTEPKIDEKLHLKGENYHEYRSKLMFEIQLGLTKTYNLLHCKSIRIINLNTKDKQVIGLQKHLEKTPNTISFEGTIQSIITLRELHKEVDETVLGAYGWQDISLRHDFYEVDYLPENDRTRYTIHPDARKEILKRLLKLNHERFEEEAAQGLHKKKDVEAYFKQKKQEIPEEIAVHFSKKKSKATKKKTPNKSNKVEEPSANYQMDFGSNAVISENCKVHIKNGSTKEYYYHLTPKAVKGDFTGEFKQINPATALAKAMLGKQVGERFKFGELEYEVLKIE